MSEKFPTEALVDIVTFLAPRGQHAAIATIRAAIAAHAATEAELAEARSASPHIREAFVAGAAWWEVQATGGTMWGSDRTRAEKEAERRFPNGEWVTGPLVTRLEAAVAAAESALAQEREGHEETRKERDDNIRKQNATLEEAERTLYLRLDAMENERDSERARANGLEMVIRVAEEHHEGQRGAWSDNESDGEADLNVQYHTERRDVFRAALARPADEKPQDEKGPGANGINGGLKARPGAERKED